MSNYFNKIFVGFRKIVKSVFGHEPEVFDPHAKLSGDIHARLDGDDVPAFKQTVTFCADGRSFVDLKPDAVPQRMGEEFTKPFSER